MSTSGLEPGLFARSFAIGPIFTKDAVADLADGEIVTVSLSSFEEVVVSDASEMRADLDRYCSA